MMNKRSFMKTNMEPVKSEAQKQLTGFFEEVIEPNEDPIIQMAYKHINAGLMAYINPNQTSDDAMSKYTNMIRMAEGFLSKKFDFDFVEFRESLRQQKATEESILIKELEKISELITSRRAKIKVSIHLRKQKGDPEEKEEKVSDKEFVESLKEV